MHSTMKSVTSEGMAGTATKNHLHLAGCIEIVGKLLLIRFIWSFTLSSRIGEMVQPSSFSIKTPLGLSVATKIRVVGLVRDFLMLVHVTQCTLAQKCP